MIKEIPRPKISPDFTMEDIYKIREWNYERRKNATHKEIIDDINNSAEKMLEKIAKS
ncbi:MAG: hypothetical protein LBT79_03030 [Elusimicrobiota bacterium]|jgi:hypothetical protein|nr:hypothetical protein [Elusimicrobiota bacterium]